MLHQEKEHPDGFWRPLSYNKNTPIKMAATKKKCFFVVVVVFLFCFFLFCFVLFFFFYAFSIEPSLHLPTFRFRG